MLHRNHEFRIGAGFSDVGMTAVRCTLADVGEAPRDAGKAIELTWGGLRHVPFSELGKPQGDLTMAQESAEGIVGHAVGEASEALQAERRSNG